MNRLNCLIFHMLFAQVLSSHEPPCSDWAADSSKNLEILRIKLAAVVLLQRKLTFAFYKEAMISAQLGTLTIPNLNQIFMLFRSEFTSCEVLLNYEPQLHLGCDKQNNGPQKCAHSNPWK